MSSAALSDEYVRRRKSLWGQGLHAMWTISCGGWKITSVPKASWMMRFYPEFIEEEAQAKLQGIKQCGTVGEYVREFKELMFQVSNVTEKEVMLAFQEGLKPWVRQEVEQRGVQKLLEAMTVAKFVVKLGLEKDKLGSSKSEERGVCEGNHKEYKDDGNGNGNNSVVKALGLSSSARGVKAKEAESEKKPVECFLCHGPHRLQKCLRKPVIEGNDGTDKVPKKLGSSKGKAKAKKAKENKSIIKGNDGADKEPKKLGSSKKEAEAKRTKRGKKKQVKYFLCRGSYELRNYPKQAVVKGKATFEHGESLEGLPSKEEVSLSSNLEQEVVMKIVKLGPMRLKSRGASELVESLTRLPPMGDVGDASDFKEKEQKRRGPFKVLEQGGQETVGKPKPSVVNQEDSVRGKLKCGQGSDITPCRRDVRTSRMARVKK
ncbi:hypothetical protein J1N35_028807 [Gossypium stocksii]|uniref:Retrotransposon gag domain-containing protein n=1 Tax=Gossypium stocksii TaxID=47602 RepID=A0A9D3ZSX6_9ROSI|nr:hypothetical protein J1N35_028807 [Gossypium stocksii]